MNSLKKALAGIFVLATIFVAFSCSNASDSGEKPDGNPFKGTKWEGDGMSLTFKTANTCVLSTSLSANYERAASAAQTIDYNCTYTWEIDDDGNYTATFEMNSIVMEFTITKAGAVSGTLYMNGKKVMDLENVDRDIEISTDGDGYPFAGTKWVYVDEDGDEEELSFDETTAIIFNSTYGFPYTSKQTDEGYTATIGMGYGNYTFTIKNIDAEEGFLTGYGEDLTYKRKN